MAIKDILVHLCGTAAGKSVVDAAIKVAAASDARLIGLYAGVRYEMPPYVMAQLSGDIVAMHQQHVKESAGETAAAFEKACAANGISYETRDGDWRDQVEDVIAEHARYADLVIMVQPNDEAGSRFREIADLVTLRAGAPVMLVPEKSPMDKIGARILVAWDGSAPAARAVRDAMPFLEKASFVKVFAVDPKPGISGLGDLPGADLAHHLASHGVNAEAEHSSSGGVRIGDILLNKAADMGADMIVTGAYGHSRIGELILGGVTDTMMSSMTVPVLMSH